jgi:pimeloyl-ACP methyl ester carboxylesterase
LAQLNLGFAKFFMEASKSKGMKILVESSPELDHVGGWMVHAQYFSLGMKFDLRPALQKVDVPALVVHGEKDLMPASVSREYAELLSASFQLILEASHFPQLEQPHEFGKVCAEFLGDKAP